VFSLAQSLRARGNAGDALPTVWQTLADMGIEFRRGQLVLIAAGPGTAKSALTLTLSLQSKVPSLVFSADSDAFTQLTRAISILTEIPMSASTEMVLDDKMNTEVLSALSSVPLRIDYEAAPTIDHIEMLIESYWELYGEYPAIIIVDNITNVDMQTPTDQDNYSSSLEGLMDYLHGVARETAACVIGLHHVTGEYNNGDKAIPLNGVKGQITRVPEMVLTLHKRMNPDGTATLCVSPVKLRGGGKPDATGQSYAELEFLGDYMSIQDFNRPDTQGMADWEERRRME
jgi:replicative DNA helicase